MIVLDTGVVSEIFRARPDGGVVRWLESLTGDVAVTVVTLAELLSGVRCLSEGRRRAELSVLIAATLEPYRGSRSVLVFGDEAADHYADILVAREGGAANQYGRRPDRRDLPCAGRYMRDPEHEALRADRCRAG